MPDAAPLPEHRPAAPASPAAGASCTPPHKHDAEPVAPAQRRMQRMRATVAALLAGVWLLDAAARRLVPSGAVATLAAAAWGAPRLLPWPAFAATQYGALALKATARHERLTPLFDVALADLLGGVATPLLHAACELGVPDAVRLGGEWQPEDAAAGRSWVQGSSSAQVAAATGLTTGVARRLLSALAGAGYVARTHGTRWLARPPLAALRTDAPGGSMCPFVSHFVTLGWASWQQLPAAVDARGGGGGAAPHAAAHGGRDIWARLEGDPALNAAMSAAMAAIEPLAARALVADGGWGGYAELVDVGGSSGSFLLALLAAHPHLRGVVFDRPSTIEAARAALGRRCAHAAPRRRSAAAAAGGDGGSGDGGGGDGGGEDAEGATASGLLDVARRVRFVGGSFFSAGSVPTPGSSWGGGAATQCTNDGPQPAAPPSAPPPSPAAVGYVLRVVLHDFSDDECLAILRNVRAAMLQPPLPPQLPPPPQALPPQAPPAPRDAAAPPHGSGGVRRLLLVEQVWEEAPLLELPVRGQEDLHMLAVTAGGRERSAAQWAALLNASGFALTGTRRTRSLFSVLVAEPVV
jgi:hypothetical protein